MLAVWTSARSGEFGVERADPLFDLGAGPDLRLGPIYLRLRGGVTPTTEAFFGYGAELAAAI